MLMAKSDWANTISARMAVFRNSALNSFQVRAESRADTLEWRSKSTRNFIITRRTPFTITGVPGRKKRECV